MSRISNIKIKIKQRDALSTKADVLALKHAGALYGVDRAVVTALLDAVPDIENHLPKLGGFYITETKAAIEAHQVLFIGVGALRGFGYGEIRAFGRRALEALAGEVPHAEHVTLTLHGPRGDAVRRGHG